MLIRLSILIIAFLLSVSLHNPSVSISLAQNNALSQFDNGFAQQGLEQLQKSTQGAQCSSDDDTELSCNNIGLQINSNSKLSKHTPEPTPEPKPIPPAGKALLFVCKQVDNSRGTDLVASDFVVRFNASNLEVTPSIFNADENCTEVILEPGRHVFIEYISKDPAQKDIVIRAEASGDCTFILNSNPSPLFDITAVEGEVYSCNITNHLSPR